MPGVLFNLPKVIAWDQGVAEAGATLTFSQTGTSTPQNIYTDIALSVAHSNPVTADSEGVFAPIYLDPSLPDYRVVFKDSGGATIYTVDNIPAGSSSANNLTLEDSAPYIVIKEDDATANEGNWRVIADGDELKIQAGNDALDTWDDIATIDRTAATVDGWTFNVPITGNTSLNTGDLTLTNSTNTIVKVIESSGSLTGEINATTSGLEVGTVSNHSLFLKTNDTTRISVSFNGTTAMLGSAVTFNNISTTGSAANAFLDSGSNNNLLRSTSSVRYKQDIEDLSKENRDRLLALRPVQYHSLADADDPEQLFYGLVAEEVAEVDPRLVHYWEDRPDGVMYDRLTVGLLSLVKELREELNELKGKLDG